MKTAPIASMASRVTLAVMLGLVLIGSPSRAYGDSRHGRARLDVKTLDQAVTAYWLRMGEWPKSLEVLVERSGDGSPAMLKDASVLIDPWGQPYHYDPQQLDPISEKPLIWSDGWPENPNSKIANWGAELPRRTSIDTPGIIIAVFIGIVAIAVGWDIFQMARGRPSSLKNTFGFGGLLLAAVVSAVALYLYIVYATTLD